MTGTAAQSAPRGSNGPDSDLECMGRCPVCHSGSRGLRYNNLRDWLFQSSASAWTMHECTECRAHYLDPRPTRAAIGRYYANYYTHSNAGEEPDGIAGDGSWFVRTYGVDWMERLGIKAPEFRERGDRWVISLASSMRHALRGRCRHRGPPWPGARLLDMGCGNGHWLPVAQAMGWDAYGMEPDPEAVAVAEKLGRPVQQGGLPQTGWPDGSFTSVTLNHVIEHLHDQVNALREIYRILEPGGWVWITTPNTDSFSHGRFGQHWRGLEPPRHLVVFNTQSLRYLLHNTGFLSCEWTPPNDLTDWYVRSSGAIAKTAGSKSERPSRLRMITATIKSRLCRGAGEELCVLGYKDSRR